MTLPLLDFNVVGPIPFHSASWGAAKSKAQILSTYLTLAKSASYWTIANQDITGSNLEALVLRPTDTSNDRPDQRIILTMNATASANAWGNRTAATADTNSGGHLQIGLCPTSASYTNGNYVSDVPLGTSARWSRYWSMWDTTGVIGPRYAFLIESQETLFVGATCSGRTVGGYIGALGVPFTSGTGEQGGRIFGMMVSPDSIAATIHTTTNEFGDHFTSANMEHFGIFIVSGSTPNGPIGSNGNIDNIIDFVDTSFNQVTTINDSGDGLLGDFVNSEENSIVLPISMRSNASSAQGMGFLRQVYRFTDYSLLNNLVTQSNGTFGSVGIAVNQSMVTSGVDVFLFSNVGMSKI